MKKRIWELDAFRGICILGVVAVHFVYDLVDLFGILDWDYSAGFRFLLEWGGVLFVLLSGLCVTLGSRAFRRGLLVFGCGLVITAVTVAMTFLGYSSSIIIYFGVLHCLGVCMMLWPLLHKCPTWLLGVLGAACIFLGFYLERNLILTEKNLLLVPLGIRYFGFATADYFPLFPNLGYFLLGSVLGRTLYRKQETLLPKVNARILPLRFFQWCGKYSLFIYMLHQPVLSGLLTLYTMLT